MPIYEFICPECKSRFELLLPMSQAGERAPCPRCHTQAEPALSKFACFTKDKSRASSPVGGSPCSGCSASSCDSCQI